MLSISAILRLVAVAFFISGNVTLAATNVDDPVVRAPAQPTNGRYVLFQISLFSRRSLDLYPEICTQDFICTGLSSTSHTSTNLTSTGLTSTNPRSPTFTSTSHEGRRNLTLEAGYLVNVGPYSPPLFLLNLDRFFVSFRTCFFTQLSRALIFLRLSLFYSLHFI